MLELGVEGIKADDGEGYYIPPDARFADRRTRRRGGLGLRRPLPAHDAGGARRGPPGHRRALRPLAAGAGQQATGITWGGDQVSDFWSLRTLVAATLTAAASGFSNWSHDVGGYLGKRLVERCPRELLLRWVQFGCFTPLMQAHGRFEQEAWRYDDHTLDIYRDYVLLHERLVPYIRAAAATAARCGLPIIRPLALIDPGRRSRLGARRRLRLRARRSGSPRCSRRARSSDPCTCRAATGSTSGPRSPSRAAASCRAPAPRERIPVWVRRGSIVVTHPAAHVAAGLGDTPEPERPLEATLWGEPGCGRAKARLADGTPIRWERGRVVGAGRRARPRDQLSRALLNGGPEQLEWRNGFRRRRGGASARTPSSPPAQDI